ncbi:MAG: hypothetical protein RMK29_05525 [Myxococcales bacterium]|nr:hypothetical protein [Myxococcota bacterium]MDW8281150.1 hypothetical protein [Myxococcales bacterium]
MLPRYLVLDVDDTLTINGRLRPLSLAALERAAGAGMEVVLNTGRSAGWGAALLAYLPGVSAVVVENGGAWLDRRLSHSDEVQVQFRCPPGPDLRARLARLRQTVAQELGLELQPTADDAFRLTDHTVVRTLPGGQVGAEAVRELAQAVAKHSGGGAHVLASSVHIHFFWDGDRPRSKAEGVLALLRRRGLSDPEAELAHWAVAVGDSGNDASLFVPGRFALAAAVRNIERYLPELGPCVPRYVTCAPEGLGLAELIDDLLGGRLGLEPPSRV